MRAKERQVTLITKLQGVTGFLQAKDNVHYFPLFNGFQSDI
jgi:hypothetical protein